ncbi:hypothetical protein HYE68_004134 [Fusarium pseudograminearum]|nr:hypothetical protein HYE68_004134 [Fusarium pseudograminearum]
MSQSWCFTYAKTHPKVLRGTSPYLYRRSTKVQTSLDIEESETSFVSGSGNGFIWSACRAYNQGAPLFIRPDDVWLAILQSIGRFCLPEMDEALLKEKCGVPRLTDKDFSSPNALSKEMEYLVNRRCLSEERKNSLMPDFTTTRPEDVTAACVSILGKQWNEELPTDLRFRIGSISMVTLVGQPCDWLGLLDKLKDFEDEGEGVQLFIKRIRPILRRLHYAAREPDSPTARELFSTMVRRTPPGDVSYEMHSANVVDGWIASFYHQNENYRARQLAWESYEPFEKYGSEASDTAGEEDDDEIFYYTANLANIPTGISKMPVQLQGEDNTLDCFMIGGSIAMAYDRNVQDVWMCRPISGWIMSCIEDSEMERKRQDILNDVRKEIRREWRKAQNTFGHCVRSTDAIEAVLSSIKHRLGEL